MKHFINKLFLCGILLGSINYNVSYSSSRERNILYPVNISNSSEILEGNGLRPVNIDTLGTLNLLVDFENNNVSNTEVKIDSIINCNSVIGKIDTEIYKILEENNIRTLLLNNIVRAKYNNTNNKWYLTDDRGEITETELNKKILTINSSKNLIMQNIPNPIIQNTSMEQTSLTVTEFGQIVNNGKILLNSNTLLVAPAVIESKTQDDSNSWDSIISNLENVAIQNENGTITFKRGSSIHDIDESIDNYPIIKGGNIYLDDFINNWSNIAENTLDKQIYTTNIKSGFYNTTVHLFPEMEQPNKILSHTINTQDFSKEVFQLFKNMHFYSDIGEEIRQSTIKAPMIVKLKKNENDINKTQYNLDKSVVIFSRNAEDILHLFYSNNDVNKILALEESKRPITFDSYGNIDLYDFLNDSDSYIGSQSEMYGVDLFSFSIDNNIIDYDRITGKMSNNIQFVVSKDYAGSKDLTLLPKLNSVEITDINLTIGQEFNNYPGTLLLDPSITTLNLNNESDNTYSYIIKANNDMEINTIGNVNIVFNNDEEVNIKLNHTCPGNLSLSMIETKSDNKLVINNLSINSEEENNNTININKSIKLKDVKTTGNIDLVLNEEEETNLNSLTHTGPGTLSISGEKDNNTVIIPSFELVNNGIFKTNTPVKLTISETSRLEGTVNMNTENTEQYTSEIIFKPGSNAGSSNNYSSISGGKVNLSNYITNNSNSPSFLSSGSQLFLDLSNTKIDLFSEYISSTTDVTDKSNLIENFNKSTVQTIFSNVKYNSGVSIDLPYLLINEINEEEEDYYDPADLNIENLSGKKIGYKGMDEEKVNQLLNINNEIIFNGNNKDALSKLVFSIEESNDETKNVLASNKVQIDYDSFKNGDETFTKPDMSSVKNYIVLPKEVIIDENGEEQIQETITQNSAGTEVAISPETTQVAADGVGTEETPANIDLSNAENIKEFNLSSAVVNIKNTSDESITIPEFNASDGTQANVESDLISENIKLKSGAKLKVNGNLNAEKEVKVDGGTMKTEGSITTPDLNATNGGAVEAKQIKSEKVTADNSNITTKTLEAEDVDIKKGSEIETSDANIDNLNNEDGTFIATGDSNIEQIDTGENSVTEFSKSLNLGG